MFTAGDNMKKLLLILMFMATVAQAETYKWTDKEGTVHFSESLGEVPANYQNSAQPLGLDTNVTTNKNKAVSEPRQSADDYGSVAPKVEELKGRMLNDEEIMALIRAMQNDPDMQALLNDPAILRAIQEMDINTLINNPSFMKMLNNPRVQEIEKRMH
jgi:hypothetical protein